MKIAKDKGYNNAGGGVYNHDMFWQAMAPKGKGAPPAPRWPRPSTSPLAAWTR